tara:strand:- start:27 stop:227 length:201 start_codon:yes stop_codon:yes gene_type:complete
LTITTKIRQVVQARGKTTTCSGGAVISRKNIKTMSTAGWVTKTFTGKATLSEKPLKNIVWGTKNED